MKAVTAIGKGVQKDAEGSKQQDTADSGASDSPAGKRESREAGSRWHDVRIQGRCMGHGCGFGKGERRSSAGRLPVVPENAKSFLCAVTRS